MDEKKIKKLSGIEQKLYRNAHEYCEGINAFFPPYQAPLLSQNNMKVESKQTVNGWKVYMSMNKIKSITRFKRLRHRKIYLLPLGPFPYDTMAKTVFENLFGNIEKFIVSFFPGFNVEVMEVKDHRSVNIKTRTHHKTKQRQLFLPDVKRYLNAVRPNDAYCICGFSWFDFYPSEDLNHILGEGNFDNSTVAFSFGHYGLYKEREQIQKEFWKRDYVVEPSIEITDNLSLNEESTEDDSSTYIYVTHNEQQEAEFKLPDIEPSCSSMEASPSIKRIGRKFKTIIDRPFQFHRSNSLDSKQSIATAISETASSSEVLDLPMSNLSDNVRLDGGDATFVDEDFELVEHSETEVQQNDGRNERKLRDFLKTAIPLECQFVLNCKVLRRLLRVVTHEICHIMGFRHCQYFSCTMNASTAILQTDTQPLLLCPICLRKLQLLLNIDLVNRYKEISGFLKAHTDYCYPCQDNSTSCSTLSLTEDQNCRLHSDRHLVKAIVGFMLR